MAKKITVIGCGVSGLSSGIQLLKAGFDVKIIAKNLPPKTTSDTAAAIWYPFHCFPEEKALVWGKQTLDRFCELMAEPDSGVFPVQFTEYLAEKSADPWWKTAVRNFRHVHPGKIPSIYKDGYLFEVPFIDTSLYMPWLVSHFEELGGRIKQTEINSVEEAANKSDLIINCSGFGAKNLTGDTELYPVQGQAIKVKGKNDGGYYLDQHGELSLCYVFPRKNDLVLGGTAVENVVWNKPDKHITKQILKKVKRLDPSLKINKIIDVVVGLRPARQEVRLEAEKVNDTPIIHNYGHGGAGFTLSWGCADEVVELAQKFV